MSFPIGACVAVISVHDAGWVRSVHPNNDDHDVDLWLTKTCRTFPKHHLMALNPGPMQRVKVQQGPFRITISMGLKDGMPIYKARATEILPDGSRGRTTRII